MTTTLSSIENAQGYLVKDKINTIFYAYAFQVKMGDDTPLPSSKQNTALDLNGDLDNIDPFKPKRALANSPPTQRKNTSMPNSTVVDNSNQNEDVPTDAASDEIKTDVAGEKLKKAPVKYEFS